MNKFTILLDDEISKLYGNIGKQTGKQIEEVLAQTLSHVAHILYCPMQSKQVNKEDK